MGRKQTREGKYIYLCIAGLILFTLIGCAPLEKLKIKIEGQEEVRQHLLRGQEFLAQKDYDRYLNENEAVLSLSPRRPPEDEAFYNIGLFYASPENSKRDHTKSAVFFKKLMEDYPQSPLATQGRIWVAMLQENERLYQTSERLNQTIQTIQTIQTAQNSRQASLKKGKSEESRETLLQAQRLFAQGDYEGALRENGKILSQSLHAPPEDEALFNIGLVYAAPGYPKKDYGKSRHFFKRLMKDYPQSLWAEPARVWAGMLQENERLNQMIEKLNQTIETQNQTVEKLNHVIEKSKQVDIEIEEKKRGKAK
jgi:tetratricopeptide (TPR) repeat protein